METLSDLQAQIDRLSLALHQWQETQDHLLPMEQRLSQLAERCAEILNHWADTDHRHALAVTEVEARLSEWSAIEGRLEHNSAERLQDLERTIEHEWTTLRQIHEEPAKHLREQAAALAETSVAAANLALRGFERSEARFAALETNLQARLGQLSADLHAGLAELRREAPQASMGAAVAPFPLERVMRIHEDLRESGGASVDVMSARHASGRAEPAPAGFERAAPRQLPETATALLDRMESLEHAVTSGRQEARDTATRANRMRRDWRVGFALLVVVLVAAGWFGVTLERRLNDAAMRVTAAEHQAETATEAAGRQVVQARAEAERRITEASHAALKAQIISNVLSAPDLIRFNLVGANDIIAQVLWSRSRGLVLSSPQLPQLPAGSTYQIWLSTNAAPVSVALFVPEATGPVTFATENPPNLPRPVTGVSVTAEPAGGSPLPSQTAVLARAER